VFEGVLPGDLSNPLLNRIKVVSLASWGSSLQDAAAVPGSIGRQGVESREF